MKTFPFSEVTTGKPVRRAVILKSPVNGQSNTRNCFKTKTQACKTRLVTMALSLIIQIIFK